MNKSKSSALPGNKNFYRCACCGGVFEKTMTNEEALAKMREEFGDLPPEERVVVCDECYRKIMDYHAVKGN